MSLWRSLKVAPQPGCGVATDMDVVTATSEPCSKRNPRIGGRVGTCRSPWNELIHATEADWSKPTASDQFRGSPASYGRREVWPSLPDVLEANDDPTLQLESLHYGCEPRRQGPGRLVASRTLYACHLYAL